MTDDAKRDQEEQDGTPIELAKETLDDLQTPEEQARAIAGGHGERSYWGGGGGGGTQSASCNIECQCT